MPPTPSHSAQTPGWSCGGGPPISPVPFPVELHLPPQDPPPRRQVSGLAGGAAHHGAARAPVRAHGVPGGPREPPRLSGPHPCALTGLAGGPASSEPLQPPLCSWTLVPVTVPFTQERPHVQPPHGPQWPEELGAGQSRWPRHRGVSGRELGGQMSVPPPSSPAGPGQPPRAPPCVTPGTWSPQPRPPHGQVGGANGTACAPGPVCRHGLAGGLGGTLGAGPRPVLLQAGPGGGWASTAWRVLPGAGTGGRATSFVQ